MAKVEFEVRNRVAYITLNRPEQLNAIDLEMRGLLYEAWQEVKFNPDIWMAVVTGTGRSFSTGHDLKEQGFGRVDRTEDLYLDQRNVFKPIVAAINGICLAQACGIMFLSDIRIASERAQIGWPQVKRGISSVSGPTLLAHAVPLNIALEVILTGDFIDAQRALQLGIVNKVVPHEQLMPETEALVAKLMDNAPLAMRALKEAAVRGQNLALPERIRMANLISRGISGSADSKEGIQAFIEKRAPVWQGR